jgi:hypothetical protein
MTQQGDDSTKPIIWWQDKDGKLVCTACKRTYPKHKWLCKYRGKFESWEKR